MQNKKYKVTCPAIGYEDTVEDINTDSAELSALNHIGMNIHEYIEVDVEEVTEDEAKKLDAQYYQDNKK